MSIILALRPALYAAEPSAAADHVRWAAELQRHLDRSSSSCVGGLKSPTIGLHFHGEVVCHDQGRLVGHGLSGNVKVNVEPLPTSLVTPIRPPCSSTKRLVRARPRPVPS